MNLVVGAQASPCLARSCAKDNSSPAIALAASTRLGQVLTLVTTVGFFILGLLSDWIFGRRIARLEEMTAGIIDAGGSPDLAIQTEQVALQTVYALVPNFQVFWLADAITQKASIPIDYLATTIPYGLSHCSYPPFFTPKSWTSPTCSSRL